LSVPRAQAAVVLVAAHTSNILNLESSCVMRGVAAAVLALEPTTRAIGTVDAVEAAAGTQAQTQVLQHRATTPMVEEQPRLTVLVAVVADAAL
jgi:hypothetical protein